MNKISFADYIRSRKLTLAGYDLKSTDLKVTTNTVMILRHHLQKHFNFSMEFHRGKLEVEMSL